MKKQRGSAILIAVFLIGAIGSAAFAIGRLFLLDSSLGASYENAAISYYVAESGIEEAMLRQRYNEETEIPDGKFYNLSEDKNINTDLIESAANNFPDKQYYYLTMVFKGDYWGEDINKDLIFNASDVANKSYDKMYQIPIDGSRAISLYSYNSADDINIFIKYLDPADLTEECPVSITSVDEKKPRMEITLNFYDDATPSTYHNSSSFLDSYWNAIADTETQIKPDTYISPVHTYNSVIARLREGFTINTSKVISLDLKNFGGCVAGVGVAERTGSTLNFSQPFTTVKSTAYYGGLSRTLKAEIDRESGTLYDIFDYLIYVTP